MAAGGRGEQAFEGLPAHPVRAVHWPKESPLFSALGIRFVDHFEHLPPGSLRQCHCTASRTAASMADPYAGRPFSWAAVVARLFIAVPCLVAATSIAAQWEAETVGVGCALAPAQGLQGSLLHCTHGVGGAAHAILPCSRAGRARDALGVAQN